MRKILAITFILTSLWSCGPSEKQVQKEMQKIENQVAKDAVAQYEIAKTAGEMEAYSAAALVAAAYLQAKDEENYKKWKAIEKEHGKKIGL